MSDYTLFPNGTSFMIWEDRNCARCWKRNPDGGVGRNPKCCIETAIALSVVGHGSLLDSFRTRKEQNAKRIADRLKWDGKSYLESDCPEREEKRPFSKTKRGQRTPKNQQSLL